LRQECCRPVFVSFRGLQRALELNLLGGRGLLLDRHQYRLLVLDLPEQPQQDNGLRGRRDGVKLLQGGLSGCIDLVGQSVDDFC
jgi:hypothetical protein